MVSILNEPLSEQDASDNVFNELELRLSDCEQEVSEKESPSVSCL